MTKLAARRREDVALVSAWAKAVYDGRTLRGHIHRVDDGFLAEDAEGRIIGTFPKERDAVFAVLGMGRAK